MSIFIIVPEGSLLSSASGSAGVIFAPFCMTQWGCARKVKKTEIKLKSFCARMERWKKGDNNAKTNRWTMEARNGSYP
jgi:hypothetical protein